MALFEGYDGAHGTHGETQKNPEKHDKLEIKKTATTVREPVTEDLWVQHLMGKRPIGIIPIRKDNTCLWGCIDIDRYDIDQGEIVRKLKEAKLPLVVCRTKSGGAHIYMFLDEPVEAALVQAKLRDLAAMLGYGGSEIFPKQSQVLVDSGDLGNWLNMPYLGGDSTERYCVNEKGRGLTLRQFLSVAETSRISEAEMIGLRMSEKGDSEFKDGPPCLQHLSTTGFPEGTRNNGLFAMGTFLKRKHPDRWETLIDEINARHFSPPLGSDEVGQIKKSLRTKDYKYKCSDMPLVNHCNSGLCRTRKYGVGASGSMPIMESLAVLNTDEPVWFLDVGGRRIELNTDELQTPIRFQRKCMEAIHQVVPIMKRETWQAIIQGLMENLTVIEAPAEISLAGQFMEHIQSFCTDRQSAQTRDEILLGKAWHDDETGRYYFRMKDIAEYLDRVKFKGMTRTQMANRIREAGGDSLFVNIKGTGTNTYFLPDRLFSVQREVHDLPARKEDVL